MGSLGVRDVTEWSQVQEVDEMAAVVRQTVYAHREGSTCVCPAADAIQFLLGKGYRIRKPKRVKI